mmetsp:Transcript_38028/g.69809  ORF Transcript_38028/g.69809 Transcript_38028/m.69809 type:complete len:377 (-) Transcript_38028:385-1515(-)
MDADSGGGGSQRRPGRGSGRGLGRGLQRDSAARFASGSTLGGSSNPSRPTPKATSGSTLSTIPSRPTSTPKADSMRNLNSRRQRVRAKVSSGLGRNKVKAELQRMQSQVLELTSIDATFGELDVAALDATRMSVDREQFEKAEESTKLVSMLEETNHFKEDMIQSLQKQLSEKESQNESVNEELEFWKKKHEIMNKLNYELVKKMAAKAQQQVQSHSDTVKAEVDDWKGKNAQMGHLYDDLVEKVGALANENGELLIKCQQLEEDEKEYKAELAQMEGMQDDYDTMHQSMEEAMTLATGMSENMAIFVEDHKATVKGFKEKLASKNIELGQAALSKEVLSMTLNALKEENEVLRTQFKEAENYYEQNLKVAQSNSA